MNAVLNDLTDVVISSPQTDHVIFYDGTNFINGPVPGVQEDLRAHFGWNGLDSVAAAYGDSLWRHVTSGGTSITGTKAITNIDFTRKTQYKIIMGTVLSAGSPDIKIVDDDNPSTNTLHEFVDIAASSTQATSLTTLPGWATGVKTLRMQIGGGDNTQNVGVPHCSVYLK